MIRRVLIVEDKKEAADYLKAIIMSVDSSVETDVAYSEEEALVKAFGKSYDVIFVDVILKPEEKEDISGIDFIRKIRQTDRYRFAPVIMITSLEDPKMLAYSELHCYSFIEKPFDVQETKKIIRAALEYKNENKKTEKFMYKKDGVILCVNLDEMIYIETIGKKTTVHTVREEFDIPYRSASKILQGINNSDFV